MIVEVNQRTEPAWARLCASLWPSRPPAAYLEGRRDGAFPHEYLYFQGDRAVGFLSLSPRSDYVEGTDSSPVGYIEGIYVCPELQGKGVARRLVSFARRWAKERGCTELASDCQIENEASRRFHSRVGFEEAGVNIHFVMKLNTGDQAEN